jgi:hypothetical protein
MPKLTETIGMGRKARRALGIGTLAAAAMAMFASQTQAFTDSYKAPASTIACKGKDTAFIVREEDLRAQKGTQHFIAMSAFALKFLRKGAGISVSYDTAIGASVDANGFTDLPLRPGARYIFVGTGGNDANDGLTHATRRLTIGTVFTSGAVSLISPSRGDQLLIMEGADYSAECLPYFPEVVGFSALYPTCFRSYDPADPTNTAKYGRADQRNARPTLGVKDSNGNGASYSNVAVQGLCINPGNIAAAGGISIINGFHNILIENCIFAYTGVSADGLTEGNASRIIIRNCALWGQWNTDGRTGGVYVGGCDYVTVEDCVIYHAGWKMGASRDDAAVDGGATVFSHSLYLQLTDNYIIVRRCLLMDGSADGGTVRGDQSLYTENVIIRCPISTGLGSGFRYDLDRPLGVTFEASYNLCLAGNDLNSTNPRGSAFSLSNGKLGSRVHHNILIRNVGSDAYAFITNADYNQPSYVAWEYNRCFGWNIVGQTKSELAFFPAQVHPTYDYNIWKDPASGTNTNENPYTEAELYTAAGVTDYATLTNLAIAYPQNHYQRTILSLARAGYGV